MILFKEGRREEGLEALRAYHDRYKNYYPLKNYEQVERMMRTGQVDLARLERLLDEDVRRYESDIAQYWRGYGILRAKVRETLGEHRCLRGDLYSQKVATGERAEPFSPVAP